MSALWNRRAACILCPALSCTPAQTPDGQQPASPKQTWETAVHHTPVASSAVSAPATADGGDGRQLPETDSDARRTGLVEDESASPPVSVVITPRPPQLRRSGPPGWSTASVLYDQAVANLQSGRWREEARIHCDAFVSSRALITDESVRSPTSSVERRRLRRLRLRRPDLLRRCRQLARLDGRLPKRARSSHATRSPVELAGQRDLLHRRGDANRRRPEMGAVRRRA